MAEAEGLGCRITIACLRELTILINGKAFTEHTKIMDYLKKEGLSYKDLSVTQDDGNVFAMATSKAC